MGGLRDAGYVDNSTMAIEHRFPDERPERFVSMANELVALDVDVLIAVPCLQRRRHKGLRERCRLSSLWYPTPSWLIPGSAWPQYYGAHRIGVERQAIGMGIIQRPFDA